MCQFCEQKQAVQDVCESLGAAMTGLTDISMVLVVGDDQSEPMAEVQQRSHLICGALKLMGFTVHPHRGNFKPQHFITVLFQTNPGSNPSHYRH
jgi:hypothetical protein